MKRHVTTLTLLMTSVSAILGSGWLFTAYYAAQYAGPAAILAWVIAGVALMFIAFVFAEINAMIPVMGASTRIPNATHGALTGFMYSWIIWLCYAAITPTEVQAIVQYVSFYDPNLTHANGGLTDKGYLTATALMLAISALNAYSIRWVLRFNTILTLMKIIIPFIIVAVIFYFYFEPIRVIHTDHSSFLPLGIKGMLSAISSGGMVYAFNGFGQACELGGAVKNPGRSLPIAIIGSIFLTLLVYLGLQVAFLVSLNPENLTHGWSSIVLHRANSPLAAMLYQDGLTWLLPLLFIGAIIGPFAASLIYSHGAAQSLRNKSAHGFFPEWLQFLSDQHTPVYAILVNFVFGMFLFAPLPGWGKMMGFLTSLMSFTYTIGPICFITLRDQVPTMNRPFRLPLGKPLASFAFYLCTIFCYFNGWDIISKLVIGFLFGLVVLLLQRYFSKKSRAIELHWLSSVWIWPYVIGLALISYLGTFGHGLGVIPFGWDLVVLAVFCAGIIMLAQHFKLSPEKTKNYLENLAIPKS